MQADGVGSMKQPPGAHRRMQRTNTTLYHPDH